MSSVALLSTASPLPAGRPADLVPSRVLWAALVLLATTGCAAKSTDSALPPEVDAERAPLAVFPSAELIDASGRVTIPAGLLPSGETPVPVERLTWRSGFSPVQTTVFDPEVELDRTSLPPPVGTGDPDGVVLVDLTLGTRLPALVETDAWPDNPEVPRLLVRPLVPLTVGHRVAVSVSSSVRTSDGSAYAGPAWFRAVESGGRVNGGPLDHYADLADSLADMGLPRPVLAVDYPIGEGRTPLLSMVDDLPTPTTWTLTNTLDSSNGDAVPPRTWIQAEGSFTTRSWLVDDRQLELATDGTASPQGDVEADLFVFIPESVRDAAPGTVPVWLFGHGIFSHPANYLALDDDPSGVIATADAAGAIVVGTTWRGLTRDDLTVALQVGGDFGRIPELTDKLAQGVANTAALARILAAGDFLSDPIFEGKPDPSLLRYYGISLGGIEGATLFAVDDTLEHGVFHVGGASWSTMLERSSNWTQFERLMSGPIPSPGDRQVLYAASQLFWDTADPALHTDALRTRSVLWQGSVGDEQVPNLTTDLVAGAVGATLLAPTPRTPGGQTAATGPLSGPAVSWFDPQVGTPPLENRPAEVTRAHSIPRLWAGQQAQTLRFLDPADPGVVIHPCGDAPCTADNPD